MKKKKIQKPKLIEPSERRRRRRKKKKVKPRNPNPVKEKEGTKKGRMKKPEPSDEGKIGRAHV